MKKKNNKSQRLVCSGKHLHRLVVFPQHFQPLFYRLRILIPDSVPDICQPQVFVVPNRPQRPIQIPVVRVLSAYYFLKLGKKVTFN